MNNPNDDRPSRPFRGAVLRGLAIVMPPLLTIVVFFWAWSVIEKYVLVPAENLAGKAIVVYSKQVIHDIPEGVTAIEEGGKPVSFKYNDRFFTRSGDRWVGYHSEEYVADNYLRRSKVLPFFISVFVLILYLLGKFVAAGVGRMLVSTFEALMYRVPLVSNVYASVKQVTDFVLTERELEFNRVVAVEYPRKGIWSIGFVTGESMLDIRSAANEPVLSVFMPTSPLPMTGFTITVLKSEAVDLNMTIDQAIQFVISCGVVVPIQQQFSNGGVTLKLPVAVGLEQDQGPQRLAGNEKQRDLRESND